MVLQSLSQLSLFILIIVNNGPAQAAPAYAQNSTENLTDSPGAETRIVGGVEALEGQFPWQASLFLDLSFFCGGSIITPIWILTAGHCVKNTHVFTVTVGTIYSSRPPEGAVEAHRQTMESVVGVLHPLYSMVLNINDIGLVLLPRPLLYSIAVNAVALPHLTPEFLLLDFKPVTISGWGKTSDVGSVSPKLRYTDMTVVPGPTCTLVYRDFIMDQKICCWDLLGHSTCQGDSGGALIYRGLDGIPYEVGIVSYGTGTCTHRIPVVFTRVTSFLDFIHTTTGLLLEGETSSTPAFPSPQNATT